MKIILLDTYPVRRGSQVFFEELGQTLLEKGIDVKKVYLYKYESDVKIHLNKQDVVLNGEQNHLFEKFPTVQPSFSPTSLPTALPSIEPTIQPTREPSCRPSIAPSSQPSVIPSIQPSNHPTASPSCQPR